MGIPVKGSRRIVVDGRRYLWRNYGNKSRYLGDCTGVICIIAQEESRAPGRPMRAWLRCKELDAHPEYVSDPENMHGLPKFAFKPSDAAAVIRAAIAAGWDPQSKGATFDVIAPIDLPLWYVIQDEKPVTTGGSTRDFILSFEPRPVFQKEDTFTVNDGSKIKITEVCGGDVYRVAYPDGTARLAKIRKDRWGQTTILFEVNAPGVPPGTFYDPFPYLSY